MSEQLKRLSVIVGICAVLLIVALIVADSVDTTTQSRDTTVETPLTVEKEAAWEQGTRLLRDKLWNPVEFPQWFESTHPDIPSVSYGGRNEDGKRTFLIVGKIRTKNVHGQRVVNRFLADVVCYGPDDWRLVAWEFHEI